MATYILNILPHKTKHYATPTFLLHNKTPTYDHLLVFGCLCYPLLPSSTIHKLTNRSLPCVFLGFPSNHRGYKCYDLTSNKIIINRHVIFDEDTFPFSKPASLPLPSSPDPIHPSIWDHITPENCSTNPTHLSPIPASSQPIPQHREPDTPQTQDASTPLTRDTPNRAPPTGDRSPTLPQSPIQTSQRRPKAPTTTVTTSTTPPPPPTQTITTRSMSGISKPKHPFSLHTSHSQTIVPIPHNPIDALHIPEWNHAMTDEFRALIENKTWELIPRRPDMNVIRCMWIFKHKTRSDGSLERHKARLVCDGSTQQVGIDCDETFSPVVKPATIRTVLSIALSHH